MSDLKPDEQPEKKPERKPISTTTIVIWVVVAGIGVYYIVKGIVGAMN